MSFFLADPSQSKITIEPRAKRDAPLRIGMAVSKAGCGFWLDVFSPLILDVCHRYNEAWQILPKW